jgi:hypothetical protein
MSAAERPLVRGRLGAGAAAPHFALRPDAEDAASCVTRVALFVTDWTPDGARCVTFDMVAVLDQLVRATRCSHVLAAARRDGDAPSPPPQEEDGVPNPPHGREWSRLADALAHAGATPLRDGNGAVVALQTAHAHGGRDVPFRQATLPRATTRSARSRCLLRCCVAQATTRGATAGGHGRA